jgi:hypothetical protein
MNRNVRIAGTDIRVLFTARGKGDIYHQNGFIRRNGKTITGYAYDGGYETVFYPHTKGKNYPTTYVGTRFEQWALGALKSSTV